MNRRTFLASLAAVLTAPICGLCDGRICSQRWPRWDCKGVRVAAVVRKPMLTSDLFIWDDPVDGQLFQIVQYGSLR
jgi:hypothetical protein